MTTALTPYDDVNAIVGALAARSRDLLGTELLALYLHGSLATGAFDPQRSDIDFIAIVAHPLSEAAIHALHDMHRDLLRDGGPWARRLEGSFVPAALLKRAAPPRSRAPTSTARASRWRATATSGCLEKQVIRERALVVTGPPPSHFIDPIPPEEIVAANRAILAGDWAPLLDDASRLEDDEYQAYAVLTMCRCLYLADAPRYGLQTRSRALGAGHLSRNGARSSSAPRRGPTGSHSTVWTRYDR
jgi:hypothetical protein